MGFSHAMKCCTRYLRERVTTLSLKDVFAVLAIAESQPDLYDMFKEFRLHFIHNFVKFASTPCFLETVTKEFLIDCLTSEEIETKTTTEEMVSFVKRLGFRIGYATWNLLTPCVSYAISVNTPCGVCWGGGRPG